MFSYYNLIVVLFAVLFLYRDIDQCIIEKIINSTTKISFEDLKKVISSGRPTPEIIKTVQYNYKGKTLLRHFNINSYNAIDWLCGSKKLEKLFCWPCLLFANNTDHDVWSRKGFYDLNHFIAATKKHQSSVNHIQKSLAFNTFGKQDIALLLDSQLKIDRKVYNEKVLKNREGFKNLIDLTLFLATHELSFRGHNEQHGSLNKGMF